LMERSALYRRALAPVMILAGVLGIVAAALGCILKMDSPQTFIGYWAAVGLVALTGSFLLVRRQALKESEPFWSPPTRRVVQAMLPGFFAGAFAGLIALACPRWDFLPTLAVPAFWIVLYGCALSAAGFFMQRGIKLLGWLFVLCGCALMAARYDGGSWLTFQRGHLVMGGAFGGLHLAYGIYLYFTEQHGNAT
jgi:hypothetical protein